MEAARRFRPWTLRLGKDTHRNEVFRMEGQAQIKGWSVTGRLLDGPYPNYRQVIPVPRSSRRRSP